jgi:hypothetical protein
MVAHTNNPSTQEAGQEDHEFKVNMSYIARTCLKTRNTKEM